ncbi:MAG: phosphate/phosphite/phosphonate ABC transporter substrate-binding protein [Methanosarcinaceae archaeon]
MNLNVKFIYYLAILFLAITFLGGCENKDRHQEIDLNDIVSDAELQQTAEKQNNNVLFFGYDPRSSPQEDARQYLPLLKYLTKATGYKFKLYFTTRRNQTIEALGKGEIHFTAFGAGSYIVAHEKYGIIPLVHGLNKKGKPEYRSVIFVAANSPIQQIEELRGQRFAFGSVTSTQSYLIPRIILNQHGITLEDLSEYKFTGSHRNCADAVISGQFDAGGMQDVMGQELSDAGLIRLIYTSRYYPSSCIAANKDVSPVILAKVRQALIDFQPAGRDSIGLYQWDKTEMPNGFISTRDENYEELRTWTKKFGLLEKSGKGVK